MHGGLQTRTCTHTHKMNIVEAIVSVSCHTLSRLADQWPEPPDQARLVLQL